MFDSHIPCQLSLHPELHRLVDYISIHIRDSQTDVYREGSSVNIAKTDNNTFPP